MKYDMVLKLLLLLLVPLVHGKWPVEYDQQAIKACEQKNDCAAQYSQYISTVCLFWETYGPKVKDVKCLGPGDSPFQNQWKRECPLDEVRCSGISDTHAHCVCYDA
ncbi:uncharacterized protein LOC142559648 [Dermacentor variabilis]|uniref:uncharacterized protein LOC142559648 n=1 Tax=Dermacentor variabilis TaxID=34621 RepID=UPI003F5BC929